MAAQERLEGQLPPVGRAARGEHLEGDGVEDEVTEDLPSERGIDGRSRGIAGMGATSRAE